MSILLHDPAWLERMYNNRALVPDYMDYLQRWAQDSAQVRANCPCALDLAYGPEAGEPLDVFPATRPGAALAPVAERQPLALMTTLRLRPQQPMRQHSDSAASNRLATTRTKPLGLQ